ncbi:MAG: response regulator [Chloroflexi bacterium]|nr:response regulator [Chloroflexota bacterium]
MAHRILVAEDDADNLRLAQKILSAAGYIVLPACNGAEAVQSALAEQFSVIIMDMYMPEMSGFDAIRAIRERLGSSPPVLALTALAMPGDRERALAVGADAYLSKPYLPSELRQAIQDLIARGTRINT